MKDILPELVQRAQNPVNQVREYLQARILESLERSGAMIPLAFHGGTALRFLYSIPRYSEDLDFALERPSPEYDFREAGWTKPMPTRDNWRQLVHDRLITTDWEVALADVHPFLERSQEMELLTLDNLTKLLRL